MKLDHVALATRDVAGPLDTLVGELGGLVLSGGHGVGFRPMQVFLGDDRGGMKVELLEPWEPERNDFLERFVARHGAGPHHLTFKVPDLAAAIEDVRAAGYYPSASTSPTRSGARPSSRQARLTAPSCSSRSPTHR